MNEVILHHYDLSPFSEKVRRVLIYKEIPWHAVEQPIMAPKPDLTPLTGGYRRIPVMQIGADIYCDTSLIIRKLDSLYPLKPVLPEGKHGIAKIIEDWADHRVFMHAVPPVVVALADALPEGFFEDRGAMTPGFDKDTLIAAAPLARQQIAHDLDFLDEQLHSTKYLLGDVFSVVDAACFHIVKFMLNDPANEALIAARPKLASWVRAIEHLGAGKVKIMDAEEALSIARDATPADIEGTGIEIDEYSVGDNVTIVADDYGQETTEGMVIRILRNQISVMREDPALGQIAVHYPRAGYRVTKI
ncbi:MAG: glutathione S-transferase family protein [Gammaproteobacteria bacterium]